MNPKRYETTLPEGYRLAHAINFRTRRTTMRFGLLSLAILALTMLLSSLAILGQPARNFALTGTEFYVGYAVFFVSMVVYLVLHELTHGLFYKIFTGRKLTYGISLSCAYCGVPDVYLYRRCAICAALAPFLLFNVVFAILLAYLYTVHPLAYLGGAFMLGMHLGGCIGDLYVTYLALKWRTPALLIRDTGAEQFFYLPKNES